MDGFLQVTSSSSNLPSSPTNSFIADEVASICPLITPSPPTNDLINPPPEPSESNYSIGEELATILQQHAQDDDKCAGDSASSSSSALAEPACTQLLNHRNSTYHHITKDELTATEETAGKVQPLQLTFRNPPENYFFMSWNWPLIRKVSLGMFLSGLVAMLALVIMMISTLPKTCDPYTEWYQGKVFYEIFPASFYASDRNHMYGDFKGISLKSGYLQSLGVRAVRLNSIFKTPNYPDDYRNVSNLVEIAPQLGTLDDFQKMIKDYLKPKNISLILDFPIFPVLKQLSRKSKIGNFTNQEPSVEFLKSEEVDIIEEALLYWINNGVEGFYLKGLEFFIDDPCLVSSLRRWKKTIGPERCFIIHESVINSAPKEILNIILNNIDLVDVRLEMEKGLSAVTKQIDSIQNGTLFSQRGLPWVHWSLGDESLPTRLANLLPHGNATLGATLLQLMLPGTPSIFYGNEIGLQKISDPEGDRKDQQHLHHFTFMAWEEKRPIVLPWMHGEKTLFDFEQAKAVAEMIGLRKKSPAIFYNSNYKEGLNRANSEVIYSRESLLVIQRWYPRRKSFVVVSNLGNGTITQDLSTLLYSGNVVIGPRPDSKSGSISFKDISLWPGESVVIEII